MSATRGAVEKSIFRTRVVGDLGPSWTAPTNRTRGPDASAGRVLTLARAFCQISQTCHEAVSRRRAVCASSTTCEGDPETGSFALDNGIVQDLVRRRTLRTRVGHTLLLDNCAGDQGSGAVGEMAAILYPSAACSRCVGDGGVMMNSRRWKQRCGSG